MGDTQVKRRPCPISLDHLTKKDDYIKPCFVDKAEIETERMANLPADNRQEPEKAFNLMEPNSFNQVPVDTVLNLKLYIAMHRLFTFPSWFFKEYGMEVLHLAEAGFYFCQSGICCYFCKWQVWIKDLKKTFGDKKTASQILDIKRKRRCGCPILKDSNNVPLGNISSVLNYKFEAHRLYSLMKKTNWKFVMPVDLAKSGFYYTGVDDNCRCIYCNLEVRGWELGDKPESEHKRWNPNCPLLKSPGGVVNIKIGEEQTEAYSDGVGLKKIGANPFSVRGGLPDKYGKNIHLKAQNPLITPSDLRIHDWSLPRHIRYSLSSNRLDSYKNWPKSLSQTPEVLSQSGFFYTDSGDRVICFHCNLGLKDWATGDHPFSEHAKWNSGCQFLIMQVGSSFIERTLHTNITNQVNEMELARAPSNLQCLKCQQRHLSKVCLPCGHANFCGSCSAEKCQVCDLEILAEVSIFF
ncbi:baculoviral IAP repeat-containing protein 7-B-like [Neocloeon triangulifer]|uniref:baculoviral IAP repeat-containing protein 7-B-like n=1 Tax=Neocloeon triangulifer TaxID=2078957 RepID=UPI00286F6BCF|nr:baculoviral IAP repeat-containing protein 7-B-like [Neocloeon triangulifer]